MKTVIITRPDFFPGETELVGRLFDAGMERLHLRKPAASWQELASWLGAVDRRYHGRIVLHDRFGLAERFAAGGIHLNSRNPVPPAGIGPGLSISRSCHSLPEIAMHRDSCTYLFLSPIYDSISKEGYGSAFSREELARASAEGIIDSKVFALGGVSLEHVPELESLGFGGMAVLGALWQAPDPVAYLRELLDAA